MTLFISSTFISVGCAAPYSRCFSPNVFQALVQSWSWTAAGSLISCSQADVLSCRRVTFANRYDDAPNGLFL